ncbi:MAG: hypothetical protein H0A75_01265 [Candidatus Methanofishera endochildressiae]|uniref:Uncharacterized protein n=1 Tax=Candidatus Methanofishera endochildressiae TaxID=2738884 RepID=A0A7Z0MN96_9GAMM|nr:hypothetical protein [Candidatus Methanofishera endochildressiae]
MLVWPEVCKGTFCTTILVRKKRGENDVTSSYDVTSAHVTDVTSGYDVTSTHVTDVTSGHITSGSTPFPHYDGLQVLKTVKY